ncbi:hypothetical protein PENFLA_c092G10466 [Penicillium flavigenum]|jgi:hypothetical protein
MIKV